MLVRCGAVLLLATAAVACADDGPDREGGGGGGEDVEAGLAVATFRVADQEEFKIALATEELVAHAERLLAGEDVAAIPVGDVVRDDPSVNEPWSWHIDPASVEFADVTTEVCNGLPSFVERGEVTSDQYCPWSAEVIAVDPS